MSESIPNRLNSLANIGFDTSKSPASSVGSVGSNCEPPSPRESSRTHPSSNPHLSPRSCVTCRRRKVRCNKLDPCNNCTKHGIHCVFPGPARAPRKPRKPPDTELLVRLRRLEGMVQSLGAEVDEDGSVRAERAIQAELSANNRQGEFGAETDTIKHSSVHRQLGHLVINEGRSRYVSNAFWASMGDEIAEMREVLDDSSSDEDDLPCPEQSMTTNSSSAHQGFLLGYSSVMTSLRNLHPRPSQVFILWEVYKENVDPLVRILHRPTLKNILINASSNSDSLPKAVDALLFAIYLGAVVSLTPLQCQSLLGEEKEKLLAKYRFGVEQALARADFLNSSSLMVLQAFVLFLVVVRHVDNTRLVWSLSGLATHLAQALGVHRDGTHFGLSPFETEMRRRLWWHISLLDTRASEDHGTDPYFTEEFYDTKLPLNINDEDIFPESKDFPSARQGSTEMTFCLIRFELSALIRRMNSVLPGQGPDGKFARCRTLGEKEKMIDDCHKAVEDRYLRYCDMSVPIDWVCATVGRLVMAKMWLMAHHPLSYTVPNNPKPLPQDVKDRLFVTSVEVMEFACLLQSNEQTAKWGWLFRTYMQWHAVVFVLSELISRSPERDYDRAWKAVDMIYDQRVAGDQRAQKGMLWKPMRLLMKKAQEVREGHRKRGAWTTRDTNGFDDASSIAFAESAKSPLPIGSIRAAAEAFGLDFETGFDGPGDVTAPLFPMPVPENPQPDYFASQLNITDSDINAWLHQEQRAQQNPEFLKWVGNGMGWTPATGDFLANTQAVNPFPSSMNMEGEQQWF